MQVISARTEHRLSDEETEHLFQDADLNDDGKIDYEEFVGFMTK